MDIVYLTLRSACSISVQDANLRVYLVQAMVHTEFNDDLERFPYNSNDGADIDEVLNVRFILICIVFDCGFWF